MREIQQTLEPERAYNTVQTVTEILYRKGWLAREKEGRAYRYRATVTQDEYTGDLMGEALARSAWPDRAPRLGIAAWLALVASAITSVVLGGAALMVPTARVSGGIAWLLSACQMALRAQYAHPGGAALAGAGGVLAVALIARIAWCTIATLGATARAGCRHRRRLRLAGREDARLGALVIDHGEPTAYCVPGARHLVVLTTGALRVLDDTQLAAVLAHERAHQSGRHHLLIALAAVPAAAFGRVPAFRHARDQVARLAELALTTRRRRDRPGSPWLRRCSR